MRAIDRAIADFENLARDYHHWAARRIEARMTTAWNKVGARLSLEHHKRCATLIEGRVKGDDT
jgi:hypothetical protein